MDCDITIDHKYFSALNVGKTQMVRLNFSTFLWITLLFI